MLLIHPHNQQRLMQQMQRQSAANLLPPRHPRPEQQRRECRRPRNSSRKQPTPSLNHNSQTPNN